VVEPKVPSATEKGLRGRSEASRAVEVESADEANTTAATTTTTTNTTDVFAAELGEAVARLPKTRQSSQCDTSSRVLFMSPRRRVALVALPCPEQVRYCLFQLLSAAKTSVVVVVVVFVAAVAFEAGWGFARTPLALGVSLAE
jgi:hypothetical protein